MVGSRRCAINKGGRTCFLTLSLAFFIILLFNNLTSSNSINSSFNSSGTLATSRGSSAHSYGIIIDAGSTGSRLFLYKWRSLSDRELIDIRAVVNDQGEPVVKKVTPGLSTFAENHDGAPEYIVPLLEFASEHIPEKSRPATLVFIFATAGMRLLPIEKQNRIVESLRQKLPKLTDLKVLPENIKVISGKWEGIYSWIAVNYMLGRFNLSSLPFQTKTTMEAAAAADNMMLRTGSKSIEDLARERPKTAGMIDMGGASAQIAFELPLHSKTPAVEHKQENAIVGDNDEEAETPKEEEKATREEEEAEKDGNDELVNLGCREEDPRFLYRIFVTTFLGFGVNEGLKKYEHFLWRQLAAEARQNNNSSNGNAIDSMMNNNHHTLSHNNSAAVPPAVADGCLPVDFLKLAYLEDVEDQQFVRMGNGDWDRCVHDIATLIFNDYPNCPRTKSCFFGGIKAPADVRLSEVELYGFSEYWFSMDDVLSLGGLYDHDKFEAKARDFCQQHWRAIKDKFRAKFFRKADLDRLETQCFKSAWIHAILHNGFYVDESRNHFQSAFRINGQEVQWALGAMIYQMRHFPLEAGKQQQQQQRQGQNELGVEATTGISHSDQKQSWLLRVNGWTTVYFLCCVALIFLLWRMWRRCSKPGRLSTGKDGTSSRKSSSYRYKRLDSPVERTV